jgi:hypothetical protein
MFPWAPVDDLSVINAGAGDADSAANLAVRALADAECAGPDAGRDTALRHGDSERSNLYVLSELRHVALPSLCRGLSLGHPRFSAQGIRSGHTELFFAYRVLPSWCCARLI